MLNFIQKQKNKEPKTGTESPQYNNKTTTAT